MTERTNPHDNPASAPIESSPSKVVATSTKKTTVAFSGPLPPPSILAGYDNILPGAAERILTIAESEADHQRSMERFHAQETFRERRRGQQCALSIAVIAFGVSAFLGYTDHDFVAGVISGTTLISIVASFVIGRTTGGPLESNSPD